MALAIKSDKALTQFLPFNERWSFNYFKEEPEEDYSKTIEKFNTEEEKKIHMLVKINTYNFFCFHYKSSIRNPENVIRSLKMSKNGSLNCPINWT